MGLLQSRHEPIYEASAGLADLNLIEAQRSRAIIDVEFEGVAQRYQSVILQVDIGAGSMLIDELFPSGFIAGAGQAMTIVVRRGDGSRARFQTRILGRIRNGAVDNYRVQLPASIEYRQRREVFRLEVAQDGRARAEFRTASGLFCAALLQDVSATGIRLTLQNDIEVTVGDELAELEFEFAGLGFHCRGEVRHVHRDRYSGTGMGVALRDFPRVQERQLERAIMQQHRMSVRQARLQRLAVVE